jgi:nicotinamide-nucleotide amidase
MAGGITCEVVTIGTELLVGQIEDTNSSYLAREMGKIGIEVRYRTSVGDRIDEIVEVLDRALARCDLVVATGGLGPTLDDLTREAVARVAKVELQYRPELMEQIEAVFKTAGYRMPENNRRQAFVPEGSRIIPNPVGTAPAFVSFAAGKPVVCLPGVPREMKHLLRAEVIPFLREFFHAEAGGVVIRVIKVIGMGESKVDSLIGDLIRPGSDPEVGLLASIGEISVRIASFAKDREKAARSVRLLEEEIKQRLGKAVFGCDDDTLESVLERMLNDSGKSLAIVETFSGGLAASRLHRLPSRALVASLVLPGTRLAKDRSDLVTRGEEDIAVSLAEALRGQYSADMALSIVGFPQGSSFKASSAAVGPGRLKTFSWEMGGEFPIIQQRGAMIGLNTLRLALLEGP